MFKFFNIKYLVVFLIAIFLLFSIGFVFFNLKILSYLSNDVDVTNIKGNWGIVALTGGRNRIAKAIELYEKKDGGYMLISGVKEGTTLEMILKRDDIDVVLDKKIDLGYSAVDTVGNAKEVKDWSEKYNIDNIFVVTSFYHVPRSSLEMERYVGDDKVNYIAVPSFFIKKQWWSNLNSFCFLMKEYVKFIIVYVQYKVLGL